MEMAVIIAFAFMAMLGHEVHGYAIALRLVR